MEFLNGFKVHERDIKCIMVFCIYIFANGVRHDFIAGRHRQEDIQTKVPLPEETHKSIHKVNISKIIQQT